MVHGLEQEYAGQIGFAFLDIDDPAGIWLEDKLGYRVQPHLLLLDSDGNVVKQWIGLVSKSDLAASFNALLSGEPLK